MAISGMSGFHASSQQALQLLTQHKHGGHRHSLTDVDAAGSSVATAPSKTGKIGSKIDISA